MNLQPHENLLTLARIYNFTQTYSAISTIAVEHLYRVQWLFDCLANLSSITWFDNVVGHYPDIMVDWSWSFGIPSNETLLYKTLCRYLLYIGTYVFCSRLALLSVTALSLQRPLYSHNLTLIPVCISIYIHYKVWDEITYPFPNVNGATVEFWELASYFSPHFTGHVITYTCWDQGKTMLVKGATDVGQRSHDKSAGKYPNTMRK